jgi:hypothetical protein
MATTPDGDFPFRRASGAKMKAPSLVHEQMRAIRSSGRLEMARSAEDQFDSLQGSVAGGGDPLIRALHYLGNNIHSLSLRLFVVRNSEITPELRDHVEAAQRLAEQSVTLIERIHELLPAASPPPERRPRATPTRRGR